MSRLPLLAALWLAALPASAAELRAGGQLAGHLLFTDVVAAEVQWPALLRPGRRWLPEVALQGGLGLSLDGRFVELPLSARVELLRAWRIGFELAPGLALTRYRGTTAATPLLCLGLPVTAGAFRVQPEYCVNLTVGPGSFGRYGGLWTGLGLGVFRAF